MRKSRHLFSRILLFVVLAITIFAAFWFGLVPQRYSPLSSISLESRPLLFTDARLAALRYDPALCRAILKPPHIEASPIADQAFKNGCGWTNAVRFSSTGGARIGVENLTCEMAAAVTLWVEYEVQPLAQETFGQRVTSLGDFGTYDCRNIIGNPIWKGMRSQHASANALDISGFTFADGRQISVLRDWSKKGPEGQFLHEAHRRACGYFRVALGPNFNEAHKNHFHFDRGLMWTCR
jgi:hypothetical protein